MPVWRYFLSYTYDAMASLLLPIPCTALPHGFDKPAFGQELVQRIPGRQGDLLSVFIVINRYAIAGGAGDIAQVNRFTPPGIAFDIRVADTAAVAVNDLLQGCGQPGVITIFGAGKKKQE